MSAQHSAVKWTPLGYAQVTVTGSALTLAALGITVPNDTVMALISIETAAVRWRDDGTSPTTTVGMPVAIGQEFQYTVDDFSKIRFIAQSGSPVMNVSFYK